MSKNKNNEKEIIEKQQEEIKEQQETTSDQAKKIINQDLEISKYKQENEQLKKQLFETKSQLEKYQNDILSIKLEYEKQRKILDDQYKQQLLKKNVEANDIIKKKLLELETNAINKIKDAKKYAIKDQALDLIDIITQFEKAVNFKIDDLKLQNYQNGFKMFLNMFHNLLKDLNIVTIVPKINDEFDSNIMECFETINDKNFKDNIVTEVLNVGYKLHDYILKPALVKVNKIN